MALIHGATGIFYFVHEFEPNFREDAIFRYPDIVEEVTTTNQMIKSLAPVLKSPSIHSTVSVSATTPIATMVKVFENTTYVFAVAMQNSPATARITVRDGQGTRVRVLGENRSVALTHGVFEDQFEGYGVHLYQIP
jgi:hypothetical protein